jgi:hypothetical protein
MWIFYKKFNSCIKTIQIIIKNKKGTIAVPFIRFVNRSLSYLDTLFFSKLASCSSFVSGLSEPGDLSLVISN